MEKYIKELIEQVKGFGVTGIELLRTVCDLLNTAEEISCAKSILKES